MAAARTHPGPGSPTTSLPVHAQHQILHLSRQGASLAARAFPSSCAAAPMQGAPPLYVSRGPHCLHWPNVHQLSCRAQMLLLPSTTRPASYTSPTCCLARARGPAAGKAGAVRPHRLPLACGDAMQRRCRGSRTEGCAALYRHLPRRAAPRPCFVTRPGPLPARAAVAAAHPPNTSSGLYLVSSYRPGPCCSLDQTPTP
jgi:hypothetical protein